MAILYQTSSFFQGWVMTWVGALEWIKPTAGIKEKDVVVMIKGKPGVGEPEKSVSLRLVDKGANLKAPNKVTQ